MLNSAVNGPIWATQLFIYSGIPWNRSRDSSSENNSEFGVLCYQVSEIHISITGSMLGLGLASKHSAYQFKYSI